MRQGGHPLRAEGCQPASVTHGIVTAHKGEIEVESSPSQGTRFTISLPLLPSMPQRPRDALETRAKAQGRVLLVDDQVEALRALERMLTHLGFQVNAQRDPHDALGVFWQSPEAFDLVLTDVAMPGLSGDRLAASILSTHPETPVFLRVQRVRRSGARAPNRRTRAAAKACFTARIE